MIWLACSVACSTIIFLLFKWIGRAGIHNLTAIVINYVVAGTFGWLQSGMQLPSDGLAPWWWSALFIGVFFVLMFLLIAATAQRVGVSVATVANKMSLVIPVIAAVILFDETLSFVQIVGIVLALVAVFLVVRQPGHIELPNRWWLLPLLLFVGSGIMDTVIKFTEHTYLPNGESSAYLAVCFAVAFAGAAGTAIFKGSLKLDARHLGIGIILGLVNYGSIWFFVKALSAGSLDASVLFPVNSMAIVACSALLAWALFREPLSRTNGIGIVLSLVAIALIGLF